MARWPEGSVRLVAEPIEPPEVASITSSRPSSVVKARSVLPSPLKSAATIESGWAPEAVAIAGRRDHRRGERAVAVAGVNGDGIGVGAGRGQEHGDVEGAVVVAGEVADGDALGLVARRDACSCCRR